MKRLTVFLKDRSYPLAPGSAPISIGRDEGNGIRVDDPTTSGHHADLLWQDGAWWIDPQRDGDKAVVLNLVPLSRTRTRLPAAGELRLGMKGRATLRFQQEDIAGAPAGEAAGSAAPTALLGGGSAPARPTALPGSEPARPTTLPKSEPARATTLHIPPHPPLPIAPRPLTPGKIALAAGLLLVLALLAFFVGDLSAGR